MKKFFLILTSFLITLCSIAETKSKPFEQPVILSGTTESHLLQGPNPSARITANRSVILSVNLDENNYSYYKINLLSSDSSIDTTFAATSATVNLLISAPSLDYILTIDGGNYGRYNGIFNGDGNDSINLTDVLALKLVKNRRESNSEVYFYSANIKNVINDDKCPIDSIPNVSWLNDTTVNKLLIFTDEQPGCNGNRSCKYY